MPHCSDDLEDNDMNDNLDFEQCDNLSSPSEYEIDETTDESDSTTGEELEGKSGTDTDDNNHCSVDQDSEDDPISVWEESDDSFRDEEDSTPIARRERGTKSQPQHRISTSRNAFRKQLLELESEADRVLLYPPSLWQSHLDYESECTNKALLSKMWSELPGNNWKELCLLDFCFYHGLDHKRYAGQYESLHMIASEQAKRQYLLDGTVVHKGRTITLQGTEIVGVSVGGLDIGCHSCGGDLWVQTEESVAFDGWYKLQKPTEAYRLLWLGFCWIANFAKYCIDYLSVRQQEKQSVTLLDFQSDFVTFLTKLHGHCNDFKRWKQQAGVSDDMRRHLSQYGSFVYDQCYSAGFHEQYQDSTLWKDIGCFSPRNDTSAQQTTVTRNTATTFLPSFPRWGPNDLDLLREVDCSAIVETARKERLQTLGMRDKFGAIRGTASRIERGVRLSKVQRTLQEAAHNDITTRYPPEELAGKLCVVRQHDGLRKFFDFAVVIQVMLNKKHVRVVWMTLPSNTICASPKPGVGHVLDKKRRHKALYPIANELFFSNDCNCFSVLVSDIVGVYNISILEEFKGQPCDFFATTLYLEEEECFVRMTRSQLSLMCRKPCSRSSMRNPDTRDGSTHCRQRNTRSWADTTSNGQYLHSRPLSNLSLFSGCGLFDRALESAGGLHTVLSIDCNPFAMCSAKANGQKHPDFDNDEYLVESVNTELQKIMLGERAYPNPGSLSAGCPCPGFSVANAHRNSRKSQRDCTLLASTMSWIEVTLPGYVVIENVPTMDSGSPSACAQAISFLVAIGYQVRKVTLKATDYGGSTVRRRLFILAAAPVYTLPEKPKSTHGTEDLNPYFTVRRALSDLESIHNDTLVNIKKPYHVPIGRLPPNIMQRGPNLRDILHRIPSAPSGQGLVSSQGNLTESQQKWLKELHPHKQRKDSNAMKRVEADGFFRTVVTQVHWQCSQGGQIIHYDQDRILSLEEVARAQGVPDDFVLIGPAGHKLKQVGNAVPWCFREAIGRVIADAYFKSPPLTDGGSLVIKRGTTPDMQFTATTTFSDTKDKPAYAEIPLTQEHIMIIDDDDDDDNSSDIHVSTKAEFEQAQAKRTITSPPLDLKPGLSSSNPIPPALNGLTALHLSKAIEKATRRHRHSSPETAETSSIQHDNLNGHSVRKTPNGTVHIDLTAAETTAMAVISRRLSRAQTQKRARSGSAVSEVNSEGGSRRVARRKRRLMRRGRVVAGMSPAVAAAVDESDGD